MKVVGMGDNVVDRYINKNRMFPGGNAVNVAVYASMCGADAAYLGNVADDKEGRLIWQALQQLGIETTKSRLLPDYGTECCNVVLNEGDRAFQDSSYGVGKPVPPLVLEKSDLDYLHAFDMIHCGCYARMEEEIQKIQDMSALRTFDFSEEDCFREESYLEKICPFIDLALFSGAMLKEDAERALVKKVFGYGVASVLVTHGADGQIFYTDGGRTYPGKAKILTSVTDTMGAGDSFFTGFVLTLLREGGMIKRGFSEDTIRKAFSFGANFSAKTCLIEGAFGFGTDYK